MIDIKLAVSDPDRLKKALESRGLQTAIVDEMATLDQKRKKLVQESDELKRLRNEQSKQVGLLKSKGEDASELMAKTKQMGERIAAIDQELDQIKSELDSI
ncbi:MAG TPA: serine--tRNA ligase, partial [Caldisericia bacterium]|nr:serine--tRNA ligase [Caldisericia bacterium]